MSYQIAEVFVKNFHYLVPPLIEFSDISVLDMVRMCHQIRCHGKNMQFRSSVLLYLGNSTR